MSTVAVVLKKMTVGYSRSSNSAGKEKVGTETWAGRERTTE